MVRTGQCTFPAEFGSNEMRVCRYPEAVDVFTI